MKKHVKYTRTRYEYAIEDKEGKRAFTLWFEKRKPSLQAIHRLIVSCLEDIQRTTGSKNVVWNGDGTIQAGDYIGHMTGNTLLQVRGYKEEH